MATVLDLGLLEGFSNLFAMLLIVALVYGILEYVKLFGDKRGLHAFVALLIGIMMMLSENVTKVFVTITPWFVMFFLFTLFVLIFYRLFGAKEEDFLNVLKSKEHRSIVYWIIIISVIILISGIGTVYFTGDNDSVPKITRNGTISSGEVGGTGQEAFFATLFHEKMLGFIMIMMIGVFTITFLAGQQKPN